MQSSPGYHSTRLRLRRMHHGSRILGLSSSLLEQTRRDSVHRKYLLRRPHLQSWHIRRSCRSCSKLKAIPTAYGRLALHFSDHQGTLIESLGPVPRDTVVNLLWINSSNSWRKTGSWSAFIFGSYHLMPRYSRSRLLSIILIS